MDGDGRAGRGNMLEWYRREFGSEEKRRAADEGESIGIT